MLDHPYTLVHIESEGRMGFQYYGEGTAASACEQLVGFQPVGLEVQGLGFRVYSRIPVWGFAGPIHWRRLTFKNPSRW